MVSHKYMLDYLHSVRGPPAGLRNLHRRRRSQRIDHNRDKHFLDSGLHQAAAVYQGFCAEEAHSQWQPLMITLYSELTLI